MTVRVWVAEARYPTLMSLTVTHDRVSIVGDFLVLIGAMVGVVFAGFALVLVLLTDDYIRVLTMDGEPIESFLSPFLVTLGLQIGAVDGLEGLRQTSGALLPSSDSKATPGLLPCSRTDRFALGTSVSRGS
jgi:hypothetical protein